jgi:hypothetical protein
MEDSSKQFKVFIAKEEAGILLSSYGLFLWSDDKQGSLDAPGFIYGSVSNTSEGIQFLFVSADVLSKFFLKLVRCEYLGPFIFYLQKE